ncbi:hypothetical protein ABTF76_21450, partial [Acinetobacter baumannii]
LKKNYADSIITLTAIRGKDTVTMRALVTKKGSNGFYQIKPFNILETTTKSFSLLASIPIGFTRCWETLDRYITGLKQLFTGKVSA